MTLYDVIKQFLTVWFPAEAVETYSDQLTLVTMLVTTGLVLFIAYNLCIGWWWKRR